MKLKFLYGDFETSKTTFPQKYLVISASSLGHENAADFQGGLFGVIFPKNAHDWQSRVQQDFDKYHKGKEALPAFACYALFDRGAAGGLIAIPQYENLISPARTLFPSVKSIKKEYKTALRNAVDFALEHTGSTDSNIILPPLGINYYKWPINEVVSLYAKLITDPKYSNVNFHIYLYNKELVYNTNHLAGSDMQFKGLLIAQLLESNCFNDFVNSSSFKERLMAIIAVLAAYCKEDDKTIIANLKKLYTYIEDKSDEQLKSIPAQVIVSLKGAMASDQTTTNSNSMFYNPNEPMPSALDFLLKKFAISPAQDLQVNAAPSPYYLSNY